MSILAQLDYEFDIQPPSKEEEFYKSLLKSEKIFNLQHWFKCQLHLHYSMKEQKHWHVSKPHKEGRLQVSNQEVARFLLDYYLLMSHYTLFKGERAAQMGKALDINKVIDHLMNHATIKKLVDDPHTLI